MSEQIADMLLSVQCNYVPAEQLIAANARIAALEAALTYYAEIRNYSTAGGDPLDAEPFILSDRGRRARAALAGEGQG